MNVLHNLIVATDHPRIVAAVGGPPVIPLAIAQHQRDLAVGQNAQIARDRGGSPVARIAIEEQWLAGNVVTSDVPAGLPARVRGAVLEALADARSGDRNRGRTRSIRIWAWVGGGLAAAAAIGVVVVGSRNLTTTRDLEEPTISFASAFEEFQDEEKLDQELSRLRDAFLELDQTVARGWGEDPWEQPVDEASDVTEDGV